MWLFFQITTFFWKQVFCLFCINEYRALETLAVVQTCELQPHVTYTSGNKHLQNKQRLLVIFKKSWNHELTDWREMFLYFLCLDILCVITFEYELMRCVKSGVATRSDFPGNVYSFPGHELSRFFWTCISNLGFHSFK